MIFLFYLTCDHRNIFDNKLQKTKGDIITGNYFYSYLEYSIYDLTSFEWWISLFLP